MPRSLLFLSSCAAVVCAASQAAGQLLEPVDLSAHGIGSAVVYRDIHATGNHYLLPLKLGLAKTGNKPALGVQYYKADGPPPHRITAVFTLSVTLEVPAADLTKLKAALVPPGSSASVAVLPLQYKLSYFLGTAAGQPPTSVAVSEGSLAAGATVALTFQVTDTKQNVRALLSGQNFAFGLNMQLRSNLAFGASRAFTLSGDDLAAGLKAIGYLPAVPDGDRANSVLALLQSKFGTWGAGEEVAARTWLATLLGAPELTLDDMGKPRIGWDLTRKDIEERLKDQSLVLRNAASRSDKPSISLLFSFGDLCTVLPNAIVDLDEGKPGCSGLK